MSWIEKQNNNNNSTWTMKMCSESRHKDKNERIHFQYTCTYRKRKMNVWIWKKKRESGCMQRFEGAKFFNRASNIWLSIENIDLLTKFVFVYLCDCGVQRHPTWIYRLKAWKKFIWIKFHSNVNSVENPFAPKKEMWNGLPTNETKIVACMYLYRLGLKCQRNVEIAFHSNVFDSTI